MTTNSAPILDYVSARTIEPRRHWRTAYQIVLWTYAIFLIFLVARYSITLLRYMGRFGPMNPVSRPDRFAIDISQSQLIRPILFAFGLSACVAFRRAYLGLPFKRLLAISNAGIIATLVVRFTADIYVAWIAKIVLVASGRPYRFMEFWEVEFVILDLFLCMAAGLPLLVSATVWIRTMRRNLEAMSRIEETPNVWGGAACIAGMRIPVWILELARRQGVSEGELLKAYPRLRAEDIDAAWAYARLHLNEIELQIRENESA